jgi:hypothetical protein
LGGRILHSLTEEFGQYLFTGLTVSDNLDSSFFPAIEKFKSAVKEAIVFINNFPQESQTKFEEIFPDISNGAEFLLFMKRFWHKKLDDIEAKEVSSAEKVWKTVHPSLLEAGTPSFVRLTEANRIIASFATSKTSREIPYLEDRMVTLVQESIDRKKPLEVISFWGASDKKNLSETDYLALDKVKEFAERLKNDYRIDSEITFILTDQHALLNSYSSKNYIPYLKNIREEMKKRNFNSIYLSQIWKKGGINKKVVEKQAEEISSNSWSAIRINIELEKMASHRGHKNTKNMAKVYYSMRKLENPLIEKMFPKAVQIAFSDDKFQEVYPELPTLYLWPYKRGKVDVLPWFDI